MKPTAYVETSVVSYLTARPSRDVVVAAYQRITRQWWRSAPDRFDLAVSALVLAEAGAGDPQAAEARMQALEGLTLVEAVPNAARLAQRLIDDAAIPRQAADDAAQEASGRNYVRYPARRIIGDIADPRPLGGLSP